MKKSILFFFLFAGMMSCYSNMYIESDDLTKSKLVTLDMWHEAVEGDLYNYLVRYTKRIQNNAAGKTSIYIQSYRYYTESMLDENGALIIDNKMYPVKLSERTALNVGRHILLCGKIEVPEAIDKEIVKCTDFKIRIYAYERPTTYWPTKKELEQIREFFKIDAAAAAQMQK